MKIAFKNEDIIKMFLDKQKLRECIFCKPSLEEILKEVFPIGGKLFQLKHRISGKNKEPWKEYMSISNMCVCVCVCVCIQINNDSLK